MATSTFSGSYGGNMSLEVLVGTVSQDVANNTSKVRVWAVLRTNGYASVYGVTAPLTININGGSAIHNLGINIGTSSQQTIWQNEYEIGHNADGTKSFTVTVSLGIDTGGYGSATVSQAVTLTTIPRASSVSAGSGTIGSSLTINVSRASDSFTHTLRYSWHNKSGTIASSIGTSASWTIPMDFCNDIPSATSSSGTIYVDTYSGSTKIGTAQTTFTASVPSSVKPTFTGVTLTDTNTVAQSLMSGNTFIQIMSNIKVAFAGAAGSYGSTIAGYYAEIVGKNQSTNTNGGTLGIMNYKGTITIRASVSDSRGRWSSTKDVTATVLEYFAPVLSFSVARTGTTSSTFTVTRNAKVAPLTLSGSQKNSMTLSFKVAQLGSTTYTADTGSAAGTWTTVSSLVNSQANLAGTYAANQSWVVLGRIEDKFTYTEFTATVATESVVLSYDKSGIGVNKIRERGALDVKGDIYANDKLIQQYALTTKTGGKLTGTNLTNVDTLWDPGYYYINGSATGLPVSAWGQMLVLSPDGTGTSRQPMQLFIADGGAGIFHRVHNRATTVGSWKSWVKYAPQGSSAEFTTVNQTKSYTATVTLPYGVSGTVTRIGNVVTLAVNRQNVAVDSVEYVMAQETFPSGYRPTTTTPIYLKGNSGTSVTHDCIYHIFSDGTIRTTSNGGNATKVWNGTVTYVTTDAFPS